MPIRPYHAWKSVICTKTLLLEVISQHLPRLSLVRLRYNMKRSAIRSWKEILTLVLLILQADAHEDRRSADRSCGRVQWVDRGGWGARAPVRTFPMALPVGHVIVLEWEAGPCHSTAQCARNMQFVQDYHLDDNGWWDIAYSFVVGGDGRVYKGVGWSDCAEHSINYNTISIGLAFAGNFSTLSPSASMVQAAKDLIDCGIAKGYLTPSVEVHGHRDVTCSQEPGDALYAIIRGWKNYVGGRLPMYHCGPI